MTAHFHLPGLFEFYDFYKEFLAIYSNRREFFYDDIDIASIYGAPNGCIWGGGRIELSDVSPEEALSLVNNYGISARLTFSNTLLRSEHLDDKRCNRLCRMFEENYEHSGNAAVTAVTNGVIVGSDLLSHYIQDKYPNLYLVSSTTKVLTKFEDFYDELRHEEYSYIVPDFRLNKSPDLFTRMTAAEERLKVEFLCNECCYVGCVDRRKCYENISRRLLGECSEEHICTAPGGEEGYKFSKAMASPAFISTKDIRELYLPRGFSNFKIEGRGLGSAVLLEMLLYYLVKPEHQLKVRELLYLDSMLNLF